MNDETLSKVEYWTPVQWDSARSSSGTRWTENGDCVRVMRFEEEVDSITTSDRLEYIKRALDVLAKTPFK